MNQIHVNLYCTKLNTILAQLTGHVKLFSNETWWTKFPLPPRTASSRGNYGYCL